MCVFIDRAKTPGAVWRQYPPSPSRPPGPLSLKQYIFAAYTGGNRIL
jgi:hypothetical protein